MNEADTCRIYVEPKLRAAGWETPPHSVASQPVIAPGRIVPQGKKAKRLEAQRPDYLLRYAPNQTVAVVEAKRETLPAGAGLQQAKEYAEKLGLKFAYATNGKKIVEFNYLTGRERELDAFPAPDELWGWLHPGTDPDAAAGLLDALSTASPTCSRATTRRSPSTARCRRSCRGASAACSPWPPARARPSSPFRSAGGCGRCAGTPGASTAGPKILYLADRNILVDDPKDNRFIPFGDARHKIEGGKVVKSRDMYFAIYQAIAKDEARPGLYREYAPDFFDLIIVDECHRGSARDDSNWREILEYFAPAYQVGMTATPLREDNRDTYRYFGNPLYTYSLRQGIEDGFLAPYRVRQIVSDVDAVGWRPYAGQTDAQGREIPDDVYQTKDFERVLVLMSARRPSPAI